MAASLPSEGMAARIEALRRITFVDVVLWGMRILIVFVVVGGTIGTLIQGRYTGEQWFDNFMFGLMIGGVYALIALGYTMVYGILRLINFAHGDVMMCGAFTSYFLANGLYRSGYLDAHPVISMILNHGTGDDHLQRDRAGGGAHLLPALPPHTHPRPAHLRDRGVILPATFLPGHVRLFGPRLSRSGVAGGRARDLRFRHTLHPALRDPHRARRDGRALPRRQQDQDGHRDARGLRGPRRGGDDGHRRQQDHRVHLRARRLHGRHRRRALLHGCTTRSTTSPGSCPASRRSARRCSAGSATCRARCSAASSSGWSSRWDPRSSSTASAFRAPYQLRDLIAFTMLVMVLIFRPQGILGERLATQRA